MIGDERYCDLTEDQWAVVEPLLPPPKQGGRRREVNLREVVNAIRYLRATGCGWRKLPRQFPTWSTVRYYYDQWRQSGIWQLVEEVDKKGASGRPDLQPAENATAHEDQAKAPTRTS